MGRIRRMSLLVLGLVWLSLLGRASEFDQYKLAAGDTIEGWVMAADGKKILFRNEDGSYCYYPFSELADSAMSKIVTLRDEKEIVHLSQHVETATCDPDRFLIPTYSQGSNDESWGCFANASINFLLWWDRIGVCHIPKEGPEADKADWLSNQLYSYVKTLGDAGTPMSRLVEGLKAFFAEYPSKNYMFEYEIIPFGKNPNALAEHVNGLNMTVLMMSNVDGISRKAGHAVSVLEAVGNNGIVLNTWGKTYMAQLYEPCGIFNDSGYAQSAVWILECTATCPDDFGETGDWIVSRNDELLVVRPVRRPDAPSTLARQSEQAALQEQKQTEVAKEEGADTRQHVFWRDEVVKSRVGYAELMYGKNLGDTGVYLHGEPINDYIFAHAPSQVVYAIPDGARMFMAWGVKPDYSSNITGSWRYIVLIDGKRVYRSRPLNSYAGREVQISVGIPPGSKTIELWVDPMGDNHWDHSVWALPRFD